MIKIKGIKPNQDIVDRLISYADYNKKDNLLRVYNIYRSKKSNYVGPILVFNKDGKCVVLANLFRCNRLLFKNKFVWQLKNIVEANFNFKLKRKSNGFLFDVCFQEKKTSEDIIGNLQKINCLIDRDEFENVIHFMKDLENEIVFMQEQEIIYFCRTILRFWYCASSNKRTLVANELYEIMDNILKSFNFVGSNKFYEKKMNDLCNAIYVMQ